MSRRRQQERNQQRDVTYIAHRATRIPRTPLEAVISNRIHSEPSNTFLLKTTGQTIFLPKYNGVLWWFPSSREGQPALENWISFLLHIVESMQTFSLFVWPAHLVYQFGWMRAILGMVVTVPLGSHLEDKFGENKGTFYASLQAVYLTFQVLHYIATILESYNKAAMVFLFLTGTFLVGTMLSIAENMVGRTCFAIIISYPQLTIWLYKIPWVIGRLAFVGSNNWNAFQRVEPLLSSWVCSQH